MIILCECYYKVFEQSSLLEKQSLSPARHQVTSHSRSLMYCYCYLVVRIYLVTLSVNWFPCLALIKHPYSYDFLRNKDTMGINTLC